MKYVKREIPRNITEEDNTMAVGSVRTKLKRATQKIYTSRAGMSGDFKPTNLERPDVDRSTNKIAKQSRKKNRKK